MIHENSWVTKHAKQRASSKPATTHAATVILKSGTKIRTNQKKHDNSKHAVREQTHIMSTSAKQVLTCAMDQQPQSKYKAKQNKLFGLSNQRKRN